MLRKIAEEHDDEDAEEAEVPVGSGRGATRMKLQLGGNDP
jgi:hypothetical protein